jgi:hypothetical protein
MAASLKLILTDAAGTDLNDHVIVDLFAMQGSQHFQAAADVGREMTIDGIDVSTGAFYRVMVTPANHRIIQFFASLTDGEVTQSFAAVPVDPTKVVSISAPAFSQLSAGAQSILTQAQSPRFNDGAGGYLRGAELYSALNPYSLLKACFLNIVAKSAVTLLQGGDSCLQYYQGVFRFEQDRIFVGTTAGLVEEAAHANSLHSVSAALHDPMPGYHIVSSYKTFDRYGNLQLTFQRRGDTGTDYAADVDIDDAQGIEHIFQVLRNSIQGPTNPYDIHDILLQQKPPVDPTYDFKFAAVLKSIVN